MQHHIEKIIKRSYNASFKKNIRKDLKDILKNTTANMKNVIFVEPDIEHAIRPANKHAAPGTNQITIELIEYGGELWTKSLKILMQACYQLLATSPKMEKNRIYKVNYHQEKSYHSLSLSTMTGKFYRKQPIY